MKFDKYNQENYREEANKPQRYVLKWLHNFRVREELQIYRWLSRPSISKLMWIGRYEGDILGERLYIDSLTVRRTLK